MKERKWSRWKCPLLQLYEHAGQFSFFSFKLGSLCNWTSGIRIRETSLLWGVHLFIYFFFTRDLKSPLLSCVSNQLISTTQCSGRHGVHLFIWLLTWMMSPAPKFMVQVGWANRHCLRLATCHWQIKKISLKLAVGKKGY